MSDSDTMRTPGPLRAPFPGGVPPRPMAGSIRPTGSPATGPVRAGLPPSLRPTDSRVNVLMASGAQPRPVGPPQIRNATPPQINNLGPMSPTGQGGARAESTFSWPPSVSGQPTQNRPQNAQAQPERQSSSLSNNDDEDVVMGQAVTPLKSTTPKTDPMGPSTLIEEAEPIEIKEIQELSPITKTSDLSLTSPESISNEKPVKKLSIETSKNDLNIEKLKRVEIYQGDNDSGVDESTQEKERHGPGSPSSPVKTPTSVSSKPEKSTASRPPSTTPSNKSTKSRSTSRNRLVLKTPEPEPNKKVPMNKIQVGHAPSPNLKAVRSKIGSLDNASYKPGGGNVKIETKKVEIKATPRIEAKNDKYAPKGGDKKIISTKLQWNAKSKIGSLENAHHKPGGGDKKIETIKTEFKEKAKPKVGSKDNVKHVPGGGDIKIQTQKIDIKAQSKVGSMDNVKHKPGGGGRKIFDDKDYLKNVEHGVSLASPPSQSSQAASMTTSTSGADENLNQQS
uniref:Microtubule-associated protein n=1 Tax=Glossina austeni TaxID=7395 RepID=A0A1A9VJ32_GLOAU